MQRKPERISSLNVERGLYVLRYVGASDGAGPTIFVRSSPGQEDSLTVVPAPGEPAGCLAGPGSISVIVADQPLTLQLTARAVSPTGSLVADLRLEPLAAVLAERSSSSFAGSEAAAQSAQPPRSAEPLPTPKPAIGRPSAFESHRGPDSSFGEDGLRILAHVARRGDIVEAEGRWIAGPDAPAPVEGLAVDCPASIGDLRYQVLAASDTRWSDWLSSGGFGGSRGRATALVGVRLRLVPAAGSNVSLGGEALFLGSAIIRKDGHELEFRSAAGLDPLLGIRLEIKRETEIREPRPNVASVVPPSGRVRVFRASGRRSG